MSDQHYLERDVQKWLEALVHEGDLYPYITGRDVPRHIVEADADPLRIPEFSIDYLTRLGVARSAVEALSHMGLLTLVSGDTSVSATTGEHLRPDIVAYNPATDCFVVFELKKAGQTAREAMTELLAYEHELQNHFPFLSSHDIVFVLVSPEWPALVDHAVASLATWGRRKILALDLQGDKDDWTLDVRLPEPWQLLGSTGIPPKGLSTAQLVLYPKTPPEQVDGRVVKPDLTKEDVQTLMSSLDLMKADGDRSGSHGFALLWEDHFPVSQARVFVTVGALNPYAFTPLAFEDHRGFRSGPLMEFYRGRQDEFEMGVHPPSLWRVTDRANRFLNDRFSPVFEGRWSWEEEYSQLRQRAAPLKVVFWGALGEYVAEFVTRFAVREVYAPHLTAGRDWSHPLVALPLLRDLTGKRTRPDGEFTPSVLFEIARTLGTFIAVTDVLLQQGDDSRAEPLHVLHCWLEAELIQVASEIGWMWYSHSAEIDSPPPPLTLGRSAPLEGKVEPAAAYANWIANTLLGGQGHELHRQLFAAVMAAPVFEPLFTPHMASQERMRLAETFTVNVGPAVGAAAAVTFEREELGEADSDVVQALSEIAEALGAEDTTREALLAAMAANPSRVVTLWEPALLPFLDQAVGAPFFLPNPSLPYGVDWDWLRAEIDRMREAGHRYPAVVLAADGGYRSEIIASPKGDVDDPSTQVLFVVNYGGARIISKETWNKVMDGTAYVNNRLVRAPSPLEDDDPETP